MPNLTNINQAKLYKDEEIEIQTHDLGHNLKVAYGVVPYWKQLKVKELIQEYKKNNPHSFSSNVKSWHSFPMLHEQDNRFNSVIQICADFIYKYKGKDKFPGPLALANCWCMEYVEGDFAIEHEHWPISMVCSYYAGVDGDSSPLKFSDGFEIEPKNGMIIAFEGLMFHSVAPTKSNRYALAMNFMITSPSSFPIVQPLDGDLNCNPQFLG